MTGDDASSDAARLLAAFITTFWALFAGSSLAADLGVLPRAVERVVFAFAARGKSASSDRSASARAAWTVPHAWFAHFYVLAALWTGVVLARALALDPGGALALALFHAHVLRRLLECALVHRPSRGSRMHVVGYLVGLAYYLLAPLTLAPEATRRALAEEAARSIARFFARERAKPTTLGGGGIVPRGVVSASSRVSLAARVAGAALFLVANVEQHRAHATLARLRKHPRAASASASDYGVPRGGWFERAACPHYGWEVALYVGLLLCCSGADAAFAAPMAAAAFANLALAAKRNRAWYEEHAEGYPKGRWAMIPGVV